MKGYETLREAAKSYFDRGVICNGVYRRFNDIAQEQWTIHSHGSDVKVQRGFFDALKSVTALTVKSCYKSLLELQNEAKAAGWDEIAYDPNDKVPRVSGYMVAINNPISDDDMAKPHIPLDIDESDWKEVGDKITRYMWLHSQAAQQYMEWLHRFLVFDNSTKDWRDHPVFAALVMSIDDMQGQVRQHLECSMNHWTYWYKYIDPNQSREFSEQQIKMRVCVPTLDMAAEYILNRDLSPEGEADRTALPPTPDW